MNPQTGDSARYSTLQDAIDDYGGEASLPDVVKKAREIGGDSTGGGTKGPNPNTDDSKEYVYWSDSYNVNYRTKPVVGNGGKVYYYTQYYSFITGWRYFDIYDYNPQQMSQSKGPGDREIIIPQTVTGTLNGNPKTLYPKDNWGAPGKGHYPQGVQKENGRYKVAVGPKIVNADYPDNGKIWDNYDGLQKGIKLDAVLINKTTGETKIIECVVADYKAHSYNKYPDGHSYNTGDTASFNVENGIIQTGIAYPNSWNAGQPLACAPGNMDSIHVIEFCGHAVDFAVSDYRLEKVIIKE